MNLVMLGCFGWCPPENSEAIQKVTEIHRSMVSSVAPPRTLQELPARTGKDPPSPVAKTGPYLGVAETMGMCGREYGPKMYETYMMYMI